MTGKAVRLFRDVPEDEAETLGLSSSFRAEICGCPLCGGRLIVDKLVVEDNLAFGELECELFLRCERCGQSFEISYLAEDDPHLTVSETLINPELWSDEFVERVEEIDA